MKIVLTETQLSALREAPWAPLFTNAEGTEQFVLISAGDFEAVREELEDRRRLAAIAKVATRNAARRMDEEP
jgi:PHD/YefM family antitoxin component YafN of YafNO toxin-antitoxin module